MNFAGPIQTLAVHPANYFQSAHSTQLTLHSLAGTALQHAAYTATLTFTMNMEVPCLKHVKNQQCKEFDVLWCM